ncbi:helix-turn-helix domain-containing protein, partial [Acinetobacter baumannii]
MYLFWSRGYGATTLDDLQEALGLQRGSLYSYFKSKEALFRETLELYQKEIVQARRERVLAAPSARKG